MSLTPCEGASLDATIMLRAAYCIGSLIFHDLRFELTAKATADCSSIATSRSWYGLAVTCNSTRLDAPKTH